jgi:hypothetical protein
VNERYDTGGERFGLLLHSCGAICYELLMFSAQHFGGRDETPNNVSEPLNSFFRNSPLHTDWNK